MRGQIVPLFIASLVLTRVRRRRRPRVSRFDDDERLASPSGVSVRSRVRRYRPRRREMHARTVATTTTRLGALRTRRDRDFSSSSRISRNENRHPGLSRGRASIRDEDGVSRVLDRSVEVEFARAPFLELRFRVHARAIFTLFTRTRTRDVVTTSRRRCRWRRRADEETVGLLPA